MVISDVNRYVFVEVPQTASTALASELVENYGGRRIFRKHSAYMEFFRTASSEERRYRVLATIRNPLDIVVSKFVKARDDHGRLYAAQQMRGAPWGFRFRPEARERAFIAKHGPDFDRFVRNFYRHVYNNRACMLPSHTHVLRYERLNEDFGAWLHTLGLQVLRPIPMKNTTAGKERHFYDWYEGDLRRHAVRVFGPYLRRWGYSLPAGWPPVSSSGLNEVIFLTDTVIRRFYLRHIHYGWVMPRATRQTASDIHDE